MDYLLDGILVPSRLPPDFDGFSKPMAGTHLYYHVERGTVRVIVVVLP